MTETTSILTTSQSIPPEELSILNTLKTIVPNRSCIELRGQKKTSYWMSGFFDCDHLAELAHAAYSIEGSIPTKGLYVTLNSTNPALLSRRFNKMETGYAGKNTLTHDIDITNWDYLPIDVDPVRPSGISSTNDELALAEVKTKEVVKYLTSIGFPEPLIACSGNGYHLLYKIDLQRSTENDAVVQTVLYALDKKFSDEKTGVDISNSNPSRIFKLYGTWARKGEDTEERPHRLSKIEFVPEPFEIVDTNILMRFVEENPLPNVGSDRKRSQKIKNPKDVTTRHPEFLNACGKMVRGGFSHDAIIDACRALNKEFPEPKNEEDFLKDVEGCIKFCEERQKVEALLPSYIYVKYDDETGESLGNFIDDVKYSNFLANRFGTIYFNKKLYLYDEKKHVYVSSVNEIQTHVRDTVIEYKIETKLVKYTPEILMHLTSMGNVKDYPFNYSPDTLPVLNGVIKIDKTKVEIEPNGRIDFSKCITLLPHGKEHLFTYLINCDYNPTESQEKVKEVFSQWIPNQDDIIKLFQAPAQSLLQMQTRHSFKKAYLIQGDTNSGKTSYFKLLIKLFSPDYISSASLQDLCEDRFVGSELEGKILNIRDDLQAIELKSCEQFKEITGDCSIGVERKYEVKYRGWATATMMFSCNYPPLCNEQVKKDAAFWSRFEYIKFPYSFNTNPKFYDDTYTPAFMSSVFNMILETMMLIQLNGGLLKISEPGEVLLNWSKDSDPIQMFIDDTFAYDLMFHDYSKPKMFAEYVKWYKENGLEDKRMLKSERDLTVALQPYFETADHRLPKDDSGKREMVRVYRANYKLIDANKKLEPESPQQKIF
jgi:phage/plasmid-associated DNA primase